MIPKTIKNSHIEKAANEIELNGVPTMRDSRKYLVQIGDALYPPKYIISLAVKHMSGQELDASEFIATEARTFLEKRGYRITKK